MTTQQSGRYEVIATRSHGMWDLDVSDVGVTQAERTDEAEDMIRDLIDIYGGDAEAAEITIQWR